MVVVDIDAGGRIKVAQALIFQYTAQGCNRAVDLQMLGGREETYLMYTENHMFGHRSYDFSQSRT